MWLLVLQVFLQIAAAYWWYKVGRITEERRMLKSAGYLMKELKKDIEVPKDYEHLANMYWLYLGKFMDLTVNPKLQKEYAKLYDLAKRKEKNEPRGTAADFNQT